MKITFKISQALIQAIRSDLIRAHSFAAERVGFVFCRFGRSAVGRLLILALEYLSMADEHYVKDYRYGALLRAEGFSKAFGFAFNHEVGVFHVHLHHHSGRPAFSSIDRREMAKYVPDFFNVRPNLPHGALVLSLDCLSGRCWMSQHSRGVAISDFSVVGAPSVRLKGEA